MFCWLAIVRTRHQILRCCVLPSNQCNTASFFAIKKLFRLLRLMAKWLFRLYIVKKQSYTRILIELMQHSQFPLKKGILTTTPTWQAISPPLHRQKQPYTRILLQFTQHSQFSSEKSYFIYKTYRQSYFTTCASTKSSPTPGFFFKLMQHSQF